MVSSEQILELNNRLNDLFIYLSIEKKEKIMELETITQSNNFGTILKISKNFKTN